jgi:hypothetical protein
LQRVKHPFNGALSEKDLGASYESQSVVDKQMAMTWHVLVVHDAQDDVHEYLLDTHEVSFSSGLSQTLESQPRSLFRCLF